MSSSRHVLSNVAKGTSPSPSPIVLFGTFLITHTAQRSFKRAEKCTLSFPSRSVHDAYRAITLLLKN